MNKNVPKLRFNGFKDEWKDKSLGNLLKFKNGVNADKEAYGKGVKFINVLDILNNKFITYDNIIGCVDINDDTLEKYSVNYGDILFQRSSETREEVGTANVYLDEKQATFGGFVIRGKKIGEYNPMFMNDLLKSSSARKEIVTKAGGSTRYNIGQDILSSVNIKLPSLEEQEKIANFLSNVDKIIEEQEGKVKDLELYKKGMMQKIFKQEIRFKDDNGLDYPAWEEKKLEDIVKNRKKGGIPRYIERGKGQVLLSNEYLEKNMAEKVFVANDVDVFENHILILWDGSQSGKVYTGRRGVLGSTFLLLELDNLNDNRYVYQCLNAKRNIIQEVWREGSGVPHVAKDFIKNFKLKLPVIEEQRKIANFLSNIDKLTEEEQKNLDDLREMKKGLLQQMFV